MSCNAGVCVYENIRLEYQIINLEFVHNKFLKIEAICLNPSNIYDREATFKYTTNNLNSLDERLKISFAIINSVAENLSLDTNKLYKLIVKSNNKIFYICSI